MTFDKQIVPGSYVQTRFGEAICINVKEHEHSLVDLYPKPGIVICACKDDSCKEEKLVYYRYPATSYEGRKLWVLNGDLSGTTDDSVRFLSPPTIDTLRVLELEGPYGEGNIDCGHYLDG
jgi:hypothetical protein